MSDLSMINPISDRVNCRLEKTLSRAHRQYIIQSILDKKKTSRWWSKQLQSVVPTANTIINNWVFKAKKGRGITGKRGRPTVIEQNEITEIRRDCRSVYKTCGVRRQAEINDIINTSATKRLCSNRLVATNQQQQLSRNTLNKVKRLCNIRAGAAEVGTAARLEAEADLRSTVAMIVASHIMLRNTDWPILCNADATQFMVGNLTGAQQAGYVADDLADDATEYPDCKARKALKVDPNKQNNGITNFFIKYYMTATANGSTRKYNRL